MPSTMDRLIIVGAGVFGVSAALHATKENERYKDVTLIDNDDQNTASRGYGRIFRTAYDRDYDDLANRAKEHWKTHEAFHERERHVFLKAGKTVDSDSGWIESRVATYELMETAKSQGVKVLKETATGLVWDGRRCVGVKTAEKEYRAEVVLVALGAFTPQFLAAALPSFRLSEIIDVVVVPWMCVELDEEQYEELKGTAIMVYPGKGEYLPPNKDRLLWVNNPRTARITGDLSQLSEDVNHPLYQETRALFCELLPKYKNAPVKEYHYCIDGVTKSQDFLVDAVPEVEGLFMATGGSLHAFKFLPVLGEEIMRILRAEKNKFGKLWSLESHMAGENVQRPVHPEIMPERDF